jgi:GAF domain-containing protein
MNTAPLPFPDALDAHSRLDRAQSRDGQPDVLFQAFDAVFADALDHRLFTVLSWSRAENHARRAYSSRPREYPVGASKPMGPTEWGTLVLKGGQTWFGRTPEDIRWAFPDHELIASLGCESCLNAPVLWNGEVLGAVSVLGPAGAYDERDLSLLEALAPRLVPALMP